MALHSPAENGGLRAKFSMKTNKSLKLEILSGPLDGEWITIDGEAEWTNIDDGVLSFPWDMELGSSQARFSNSNNDWEIDAFPNEHGTYIYSSGNIIRLKAGKHSLKEGDILKASRTWIWVKEK